MKQFIGGLIIQMAAWLSLLLALKAGVDPRVVIGLAFGVIVVTMIYRARTLRHKKQR